jgi:hypothetical protein
MRCRSRSSRRPRPSDCCCRNCGQGAAFCGMDCCGLLGRVDTFDVPSEAMPTTRLLFSALKCQAGQSHLDEGTRPTKRGTCSDIVLHSVGLAEDGSRTFTRRPLHSAHPVLDFVCGRRLPAGQVSTMFEALSSREGGWHRNKLRTERSCTG